MPDQRKQAADLDCGSWKAAQLAEFQNVVDLIGGMTAMLEIKRNEISALRKVVGESARGMGRGQPRVGDFAELIEATFAATTPHRFDTARSMALRMQQRLVLAIASLGDLPQSHDQALLRVIADATNEALVHARRTADVLSQVTENADKEVRSLQDAYLAFSVA